MKGSVILDCSYIIKKRRIRKILQKIFIFLLTIIFIFTFMFIYLEYRLSPIIAVIAEHEARQISTVIIDRTVCEQIEYTGLTYEQLVHFEKDTSGKVAAITTNAVNISKFKSYVTIAISKALSELIYEEVTIPIGTIIYGDLFLGRGPKIKIRLNPVGSVSSNIYSEFSSAGINQTKHRIMIELRAEVSVLIPFRTVSTEVSTSVCIAETVLVGDVPSTYADIDFSRPY